MFYIAAPNKIVIILTKLKIQNVKVKYLEGINQLVKKSHTAEEIIEISSLWNKRRQNVQKHPQGLLSKLKANSVQNLQVRNHHRYEKKRTLCDGCFQIKLYHILFGDTPSKNLNYIEAS